MGPRLFSRGNCNVGHYRYEQRRFNGAAAVQPREPEQKQLATGSIEASMGPRLFSRGNGQSWRDFKDSLKLQWGRGCSAAGTTYLSVGEKRLSGFNGAAAVQPREPHKIGDLEKATFCFNGAAAVQPREREEMSKSEMEV